MIEFSNESLINVLLWLAFGFVAGLIAHLVSPGQVRGGVLGTILSGVFGALLGGFLAQTFLGLNLSGFNIQSLLIAVAGAIILSFIQRLLFRDTRHIKTPTEHLG